MENADKGELLDNKVNFPTTNALFMAYANRGELVNRVL